MHVYFIASITQKKEYSGEFSPFRNNQNCGIRKMITEVATAACFIKYYWILKL